MSLLTDLFKFFEVRFYLIDHTERVWGITYTTTITVVNEIEDVSGPRKN
jgi:hypothetical protein